METTYEKVTGVDSIFKALKVKSTEVRLTNYKTRRKKLKQLEQALLNYRGRLYEAMWNDFQKPQAEVDLTEVYTTLSEIRLARKELYFWMRDEKVSTPLPLLGSKSFIRYEAKGVCLILAPWNYPIQLVLAPLISAIAAGNVAIIKPSEHTPHTNKVLKALLAECFEENEVCLLEGGVELATELLSKKFDHIFFTGAPEIGKIVMGAAAKNLTSVTLELGGKSPTIIDETANLKKIVPRIGWAKFVNAGQTCIAPDYVVVHESQKDKLVTELKNYIEKAFGKESLQSEDYPNIVNTRHFDRINGYLQNDVSGGAKVVYGGAINAEMNTIQPTIVVDPPMDGDLMTEEIFGPVLPILTYNNKEEVIELINSKEKPLALYIFSEKSKNIKYFLDHSTAGGTCINAAALHIGNYNLPFGGVNNSGIGKSRGKFGFLEFSNARGVYKQVLPSTVELMAPPYTNFKQKLIDLTIKWF